VGLDETHGFHLIPKYKKVYVLGLRTSKRNKIVLEKIFK
jgi:hypothetical protein